MAIKFNRSQTFATNGTVTAAALHNLIDGTDIYQALITDQTAMTSVGSLDKLLIADSDLTAADAPRSVTVNELFEDALTLSTYTNVNATNLRYTSATGNYTLSTGATITNGTIAALNSTTGTIATLNSTTPTFLGAITASTNTINVGSGQIYKDASGNVGIGSTSPSTFGVGSKLVVSGAVTNASINYSATFSDGTTNQLRIGHKSGIANILSDAAAVAICTSGTQERIRANATGVGISTTSPTQLLEVGDTDTPNNYIQVSSQNNTAAGIKFRGDFSKLTGWDVGYEGNGDYLFFRNDTQGTVSERLRILNAGQIGIGGANYGTSGQVLTSNGAGAAPSWTSASSTPADGSITYAKLSTSSTEADNVANRTSKAWVNFNGVGTVAIRDDFNVSSITDNGVGDYSVVFSSPLANANYAFATHGADTATDGFMGSWGPSTNFTQTTALIRLQATNDSSGASFVQDLSTACVTIFGS
jgi:hypothetical protein